MYNVSKASKSQPSKLRKYLYLANIGLYSLAVHFIIFTAEQIMGWWHEDSRYQLNYVSFIWLPIGLLLLNPFIWRRVYPTLSLEIGALCLLLLNLFLLSFMESGDHGSNLVGWRIVTLISTATTLYVWSIAKPWQQSKHNN
ncbi:hypothetical protein ACP8Y2_21845 [Herpetosiphon llansteffanensis]